MYLSTILIIISLLIWGIICAAIVYLFILLVKALKKYLRTKPVREEKLMDVRDRAAQRVQVEERALFLKLEGEMVRVALRDIRYLEVQQNYVTIHAGQDYTLKSTLAKLAEELDERFFQLGRSYIVNLHFVQRVTRQEAILQDGARIPLPRGYYDKINRAIIERC